METPSGSFYGGGYPLTPTYTLNAAAMTPPRTPSSAAGQRSQNININQKLDLMLSLFMEQKKTVEETKATTDELQKQVGVLSSGMTELKNKVDAAHTQTTNGSRKKIPPHISVSRLCSTLVFMQAFIIIGICKKTS